MKLPTWPTLFAVAGGAGLGLSCMMLLMNKQRDKQANEATFVKRAIDIMEQQQTVKELLGDNIQVGRVTLNDGWGNMQRLQVQVRVPVKGERDNAFLYAYARRKDEQDKLKLYRLEATFNKIAGKKLVIMDRTNEVDNDNSAGGGDDERTAPNKAVDNATKPQRTKTKEEMKEEMKNWSWR